MNKLNYLSIIAMIILLIGNVLLCSNLSKQNSNIKKEISNLKQEQINQQTSQKEDLENLQNLVTFNWKEYQNEKFGFSFKYPEYMSVCDETMQFQYIEKSELIIGVRHVDKSGACDMLNAPLAQIKIKKNTENYKTAEETFKKEFSHINWSKNSQLGYFEINKIKAYGGIIISDSSVVTNDNKNLPGIEGYDAVILKSDYIIKIYGMNYGELSKSTEQLPKDKPVFDAIISSLNLY